MYNARMPEPDEAARYHRLQLWLALAGFVLGAVCLLVVLTSGAGAALAEAVAVRTSAWWTGVALVAAVLAAC
jgi:hypothetical protein